MANIRFGRSGSARRQTKRKSYSQIQHGSGISKHFSFTKHLHFYSSTRWVNTLALRNDGGCEFKSIHAGFILFERWFDSSLRIVADFPQTLSDFLGPKCWPESHKLNVISITA